MISIQTIPDKNISLLNFAHLHTTNDFKQLFSLEEKTGTGITEKISVRNYLPNFPPSFWSCFKEERSHFEKMNPKQDPNIQYNLKSPCITHRHHEVCKDYCNWNNWSKFFSREEFFSLMKYSLPQGKSIMKTDESVDSFVEILSQNERLNEKNLILAPVPLVIFCKYQKTKPWKGQDIGMKSKVCDDFEQVHSDVGICLTGGIDTAKIFKNNDFGHDQTVKKIKGGTYSGVSTFIIDTDAGETQQTLRRNLDAQLDEVQVQIHPTNEMAQITHDEYLDHDMKSFVLKKGYEYTLEVTINGRITTKEFQNLPYTLRRCKLQSEGEENSWFKSYSKQHCKYECRSKLAYDKCGCFPWDFYQNGNYPECDIFGRTCFLNVLENVTHEMNDTCNDHCYDDCEFLQYRYQFTKSKPFESDGKYIVFDDWGKCNGTKVLCDYINNKIKDMKSLRCLLSIKRLHKDAFFKLFTVKDCI